MQRLSFAERLERLGPLSLLALFVGGLVLIFVGVNGFIAGWPNATAKYQSHITFKTFIAKDVAEFQLGARLGIQAWLAIVGVGFGLLSYGFGEAYYHLFDWWCTRRACDAPGLDYARYLNTQSRAPVAYGIRGFAQFVTLRNFITCMSIAASIGYKFGIVQSRVSVSNEPVPINTYFDPTGTFPAMTRLEDSPFINLDSYPGLSVTGRRFYHWMGDEDDDWDYEKNGGVFARPPKAIFLVGEMTCDQEPQGFSAGILTTYELVLVANMTEEEGSFIMTNDKGDWERIKVDNWIVNASSIVDYRVRNPTQMQIQWAPLGEWYTNSELDMSQNVLSRVTYEVRYATAEVCRSFGQGHTCGMITDFQQVQILSLASEPISFGFNTTSLPHKWIDLGMSYRTRYRQKETGWGSRPIENHGDGHMRLPALLDGVSAFVRIVMAELPSAGCAVTTEEGEDPLWQTRCNFFESPEHIPMGYGGLDDGQRKLPSQAQSPFGTNAERVALPRRHLSEYPYFHGLVSDAAGCILLAAIIYMLIGCLAIVVGIVRIWMGPPMLTSWVGQHVYLAGMGVVPISAAEDLATGYKAASQNAGTLRLKDYTVKKGPPHGQE